MQVCGPAVRSCDRPGGGEDGSIKGGGGCWSPPDTSRPVAYVEVKGGGSKKGWGEIATADLRRCSGHTSRQKAINHIRRGHGAFHGGVISNLINTSSSHQGAEADFCARCATTRPRDLSTPLPLLLPPLFHPHCLSPTNPPSSFSAQFCTCVRDIRADNLRQRDTQYGAEEQGGPSACRRRALFS